LFAHSGRLESTLSGHSPPHCRTSDRVPKGMPQERPEPYETFPAPPASDRPDPKVTFNVEAMTSLNGVGNEPLEAPRIDRAASLELLLRD
jgi:hypothetical protein